LKVTNVGGKVMRIIFATISVGLSLSSVAYAQQTQMGTASDQDFIKQVMKAAPQQVGEQATIMRMHEGGMQTVKKGTNEFTCMDSPAGGSPMCLDPNAMEWVSALASQTPPPDKTGFAYMLAGDTGGSNTDPFAKEQKPDNHWVRTGPHVMIVGSGAKAMQGYPRSADPDPTKPYVMWPGTPYEHLMIPVK
jgi:hypothetical protein